MMYSRIFSPLLLTGLLILADAGGLRGLKKNNNNNNNAAGSSYTSFWASGNVPTTHGQNTPDLSQGSVGPITVNGGDRTISNNVPPPPAGAAAGTTLAAAATTNAQQQQQPPPQQPALTVIPPALVTVIPPANPSSSSNTNGAGVGGITVTRPDGTVTQSVGTIPTADRTEPLSSTTAATTTSLRPISTSSSNGKKGKGKGKGKGNKSRQIDASEATTTGNNWVTGSVGVPGSAAPDLTQASVGAITVTRNP